MLKKYTHTYKRAIMLLCILISGIVITACNNDDDGIGNITQLNSFGPSPALRGGDLRFIGVNLDKVTTIILPGNVEVTSFKEKTSSLIVIEVPEETVEGKVILKTSNGDIETKTILGISEPITIESIEPIVVRPGDVITIKGTYLNLIDKVAFSDNKVVADFESQSKSEIKVKVPHDAQTGNLILITPVEDEGEIPIEVESEEELEVILPKATALSPKKIRPNEDLIINGTNLDLAIALVFPGGTRIDKEDFTLTEDGEILVKVPQNSQDGAVSLIAPSTVETPSSEELEMIVPTLTSLTPNPVKRGEEITVKGANLDLVTSVKFNTIEVNDEDELVQTEGEIMDGGSATEIKVKVPSNATDGIVAFNTAASKVIESADVLTLFEPVITSIAPLTVKTKEDITILGDYLDLVSKVIFEGNIEGNIVSSSASELIVTVSPKSLPGKITLVANNGKKTLSDQALDIQFRDVPTITSIPTTTSPGQMIMIEGTNLDLTVDVVFPNNIKATTFGLKTSTHLEVMVPANAEVGEGKVKLITTLGEFVESEMITIQGQISYYIYNDALNSSDWDLWGGWGLDDQDLDNSEQPMRGSKAVKLVFNDSWGAFQLHPKEKDFLTAYEAVSVSIYGTIPDSKMAIVIGGVEKELVLKAGEYTTFEVMLSEFGDLSDVSEFLIKNYGTNPNTVYVDDIGLR